MRGEHGVGGGCVCVLVTSKEKLCVFEHLGEVNSGEDARACQAVGFASCKASTVESRTRDGNAPFKGWPGEEEEDGAQCVKRWRLDLPAKPSERRRSSCKGRKATGRPHEHW